MCGSAIATTLEIDPSKDASLPHGNAQQAATNYGSSQYLMLTSEGSDVALIQFNLASIPTNAIIDSAVLQLHAEATIPGAGFIVNRNTTAWDEATVTWNSRPTYSDQDGLVYLQSVSAQYQIDLTNWVGNWVAGFYSNQGITLTTQYHDPVQETPDPLQEHGPYTAPTIYSREYVDLSLRPQLCIDYHVVPEPSAFAVLACGMVGILTRTRKRRSS